MDSSDLNRFESEGQFHMYPYEPTHSQNVISETQYNNTPPTSTNFQQSQYSVETAKVDDLSVQMEFMDIVEDESVGQESWDVKRTGPGTSELMDHISKIMKTQETHGSGFETLGENWEEYPESPSRLHVCSYFNAEPSFNTNFLQDQIMAPLVDPNQNSNCMTKTNQDMPPSQPWSR